MILLHDILVKGDTPDSCCSRVKKFFSSYQLIRYDSLVIADESIIPSSHPDFWPRIDQGIKKNRDILDSFLSELSLENITTIKDLASLRQGYATALLHTACHILDGFFGIDSFFYNLEEDSHWVTGQLRRDIKKKTETYYLLTVTASLASIRRGGDEQAPLGHRRDFREHINQAIFKT